MNPLITLSFGCDDEYGYFLISELERLHQRGLTTISIPELIENSSLHRVNSASIDDQPRVSTPIQYEISDDDEVEYMLINDDDSSHAIYDFMYDLEIQDYELPYVQQQ